MQEQIAHTLEAIQNQLRKHSGKIIGTEFQPMLELLKIEIEQAIEMEKAIEIEHEAKPMIDDFFEKLSYQENGKGKYAALGFLLSVMQMKKAGKDQLLPQMGEFCRQVVKELSPRHWEFDSIALASLQKIINACRDGQSFLNPKIAKTYEFEIKESRLNEKEKRMLLEFIKGMKN